MPDVNYICLSDLHLGEEDSLLTNLQRASSEPDYTAPSPVLEKLVSLLRSIVSSIGPSDRPPTLILNGDALEMALCPVEQAAMFFEQFVSLVLKKDERLFDKIIVIPGNHDHHLWEIARETLYVNYIAKDVPAGERLPGKWSVTNLFAEDKPLSSYLLDNIIRRHQHLKDEVIQIAYPNLGLVNKSKGRIVVFHHGHFVEELYLLMSKLKTLVFKDQVKPNRIWDIESENFSWIDFFWSTMGSAGEVGEDLERIYERLQDPDEISKLVANLVVTLTDPAGSYDWDDRLKSRVLQWGLSPIFSFIIARERSLGECPLSERAQRGLRWYLSGPLKRQIENEIKERPEIGLPGFPEVTFVFGHTHKPFADDLDVNGYHNWVHTFNTGGWVVDKLRPEPCHGASLVLVDESLNTVALQLYKDDGGKTPPQLELQTAQRGATGATNFVKRVNKFLRDHPRQLNEFSDAVSECTRIRREHLVNRVHG